MYSLNEETRRKLRELNLNEVIEILDEQAKQAEYLELSFNERIQLVVDHVYQVKYNNKVKRLMNSAKFRIANAAITDVHYIKRGLDKSLLMSLSTAQFIDNNINIIFHGFTGSGKSYLACAIGKEACLRGIRTRYIRLPDLLMLRDEADLIKQGFSKLLKKFSSYKLLIIDEWLLDELSDEEQHFIFELIERRHDSGSTIFCTQFKTDDWHERLGGGVHADAMMDRIIHNAAWVYTGDLNMRKFYSKNNEIN
jgi:DNA replication protein DnaC